MRKVAVLMGGRSTEREVSLRSGESVYLALLAKGYDAIKIDVNDNVVDHLKEIKPEVVFIALHGKYGEDGTIQGLLELLGIPFTGSGVLSSAICMNKIYTKKILTYEGISTAKFRVITTRDIRDRGIPAAASAIMADIGLPVVVKPATQGSTIGIQFVKEESRLAQAITEALKYDSDLLVEQMIQGVEVTASIIGDDPPLALPLIEIVSTTGVYDYESKYTVGMSEHIIPPRLSEAVQQKVKDLAIRTFQTLGCQGYARIDFMVDTAGTPYVLEANTAPGMTSTSLFPDAARAAGIEFPELVEILVENALKK
ncbi:MAG: D-alanine--D-alanine ligase [Firmicutes bacterium]|nr:D-alanine--D-alanine ligase [Bacillota bacterium]